MGTDQLAIGTGDVPGVFDPADSSNFTLTLLEDAFGNFGATSTSLFQFFINEAPTAIEIDSDNIDEAQVIGSLVGNFTAIDSNPNDILSFQLGGTDAGSFTLGGSDGNQLLASEVFNASVQDEFNIDVTVTDATGESFTESFTIFVNDILLDVPVISPAEIGAEEITLDISNVDGATGFEIDVSTDNFESFVDGLENFEVAGNQAVLQGLISNTDYNIRARALNVIEFSAYSETLDVTTLPGEITIVESNVTANSFDIDFASPDGASSFEIDVSTDGFETFVSGFEDLVVDAGSITVDGLTSNTTFNVRARAVNASGTGVYTEVLNVTTTPNAITIAESNVTTSSFDITFTSPDEGIISFEIDVTTDGFETFVGNFQDSVVNGTSVTVSGLTSNTTYEVRARAINGDLVGSYTDVINVITIPVAPTALEATDLGTSGFTANWDTDDNSNQFLLDVSADDFTTFEIEEQEVTGTSFDVTGLSLGIFQYRVRATNASGDSENSNVINVLLNPLSTNLNELRFSVSPNPSEGLFQVQLDAPVTDELIIEIYSVSGKLAQRSTITNSLENTLNLDLTGETSGTYIMKITDGDNINKVERLFIY